MHISDNSKLIVEVDRLSNQLVNIMYNSKQITTIQYKNNKHGTLQGTEQPQSDVISDTSDK